MTKKILVVFMVAFAMAACSKQGAKTDVAQKNEASASVEKSVWGIIEIVDEFKDPTGDVRLAAMIDGVFSNSATRGSDLTVFCFVDITDKEPNLSFRLLEYGSIDASVYNEMVMYSVKDGAGNKHTFCWSSPQSSTKFFKTIDNTYIGGRTMNDFMLPIFMKGGIVTIIITEGNSTYNFEVDCTDFTKLLDEAKSKYKKKA